MNSEFENNYIFETSVVIQNIQSDFPRVKAEKIAELKRLDPTTVLLAKLVAIFYSEVTGRLPELEAHCRKEEYQKLLSVIHRFKSTTYNLGAIRAVEIANAIEYSVARKRNHVDIENLISALKKECLDTHKVLLTYLSNA